MKKSVIFYSLLFLCASCHKHNAKGPEFPAETQNGLNTFGCYIDNKAFVPATTLFGNVRPINVFYAFDGSQGYKPGFLSIQGIDARYSLDYAGNVLIQKLELFKTGEYLLRDAGICPNPYECDGGGYYNAKEGKTYFIESGMLTITRLDTANKIISGKFYFTAKDTLGNRKDIKNGVFDCKFIN